MTDQPRIIRKLLAENGDREFKITERQFYGLVNGWTHLALMDEKSIIESVYDQCISNAPAPDVLEELKSSINLVSLSGFTKYGYRKWILKEIAELRQQQPGGKP